MGKTNTIQGRMYPDILAKKLELARTLSQIEKKSIGIAEVDRRITNIPEKLLGIKVEDILTKDSILKARRVI